MEVTYGISECGKNWVLWPAVGLLIFLFCLVKTWGHNLEYNLIVKNAGLTLSCLSDTFRKIHPTWQNEKIFNMENKCNKIISGILNWS